jgi:peptide/nickel transport system permease protein
MSTRAVSSGTVVSSHGPRRRRLTLALAALILVYLAAVFAGFLAPYDPTVQHRDFAYAPPTRVHFFDSAGRLHLRPFVYASTSSPGDFPEYAEDRRRAYPVRFVVKGVPYTIAGLFRAEHHLVGVDGPARLFLLGADGYGRDQLSRFFYGGQISLFAGLLGAGLSLGVGLLLGGLAGFYRGWIDTAIMRAAELFLAVPWFYLLFTVRMALPLQMEPAHAFLLILSIIGLTGWARPARLVRGVVLSARVRDYVAAARALGASDFHVLRRHVLPQALGVVVTQAAVLAPQFILAEVTLSFFGLGVGEPAASWGNMLAVVQRYDVLASYWWMFIPGVALIPVFLLYYVLADALHQRAAALPV